MSASIAVSASCTSFSNFGIHLVSYFGSLVSVGMRDGRDLTALDLALLGGGASCRAVALVWDLLLWAGGTADRRGAQALLICVVLRRFPWRRLAVVCGIRRRG